jgi:hypothetical protein
MKTILCPETLSISHACAMLREMEAQGIISNLGGSWEPGRKCPEDGMRLYNDAWFEYRGQLVNAHHFGIVYAVFDVLNGRPAAAEYSEWGPPKKAEDPWVGLDDLRQKLEAVHA